MRFCEYFKINDNELEFLDIDIDADYPFFIDPLLLSVSDELPGAYDKFLNYFNDNSNTFQFKEVKQTHLGFGYHSFIGHGIGPKKAATIRNNKFLIDYGYGLDTIEIFTKGIGIDMISDMTTNIILEDLLMFTEKVCQRYDVPTQKCKVEISPIKYIVCNLPIYNYDYIILCPKSILRKKVLLLSKDNFARKLFDIIPVVENATSRMRLNDMLYKTRYKEINGKRVEIKTKLSIKDRKKIINALLDVDPELIKLFKEKLSSEGISTNIKQSDITEHGLNISAINTMTEKLIAEFQLLNKTSESYRVKIFDIVNYYKNEIENGDLIKVFSHDDMRSESTHQSIFRTVAKSHNIGINAEVNNGSGSVDFKCVGTGESILIEFKLAKASNAKNVYSQLDRYFKDNLEATSAFVVFIAYTDKELEKANQIKSSCTDKSVETIIINCNPDKYKSASKK
ncbi:MAG: hypothetical protein ACK5LC_00980 [Coprobacillaceae bacterium]